MIREESVPLRLRFRLEIVNWSIIKKQNIYIEAARRRVRFRPVGQKAIEKQKTLVWLLAFKPTNKYLAFCSRMESPDGSIHKGV